MTGPLGRVGRCVHDRKICSTCIVADDAAKRAYDHIMETVTHNDLSVRLGYPWMALRLSDGDSDGRMYETRRECVRNQVHEQQCAYFSFRLEPGGFRTPRDAAIFLAFYREAYDSGFRLTDPDDREGGQQLVMPHMNEHLQNQLTRMGNRRVLTD